MCKPGPFSFITELEPGQRWPFFNGGEGLHHLVLVEAVDQGFLGWGRHGGCLSLVWDAWGQAPDAPA